MTLPKFPRGALQVLRVIRADVPRPEKLPCSESESHLRWPAKRGTGYDGLDAEYGVCPMGLHPESTCYRPTCTGSFADGRCADASVERFFCWWDRINPAYAAEAVDFVWPVTT